VFGTGGLPSVVKNAKWKLRCIKRYRWETRILLPPDPHAMGKAQIQVCQSGVMGLEVNTVCYALLMRVYML